MHARDLFDDITADHSRMIHATSSVVDEALKLRPIVSQIVNSADSLMALH
jgi:hypothetical protein